MEGGALIAVIVAVVVAAIVAGVRAGRERSARPGTAGAEPVPRITPARAARGLVWLGLPVGVALTEGAAARSGLLVLLGGFLLIAAEQFTAWGTLRFLAWRRVILHAPRRPSIAGPLAAGAALLMLEGWLAVRAIDGAMAGQAQPADFLGSFAPAVQQIALFSLAALVTIAVTAVVCVWLYGLQKEPRDVAVDDPEATQPMIQAPARPPAPKPHRTKVA
jgi:hypothetical protein